jgi:hypothetical protein
MRSPSLGRKRPQSGQIIDNDDAMQHSQTSRTRQVQMLRTSGIGPMRKRVGFVCGGWGSGLWAHNTLKNKNNYRIERVNRPIFGVFAVIQLTV